MCFQFQVIYNYVRNMRYIERERPETDFDQF